MKQGLSLALKAKVVCLAEKDEVDAYPHNMLPKVLEKTYHDHVALATTTFWHEPATTKAYNDMKNNPGGKKEFSTKTETCDNCHDRNHFIKDCPYENRDQHGGRLVPKEHSKLIQKNLLPRGRHSSIRHQV